MKIIDDITNYIFVDDNPEKADIIFIPGSTSPELPEMAAKLYLEGYAPLVLPSGNVSIKSGKFGGVKSKQDIYDKDYQTECEFYSDVLIKNGVAENAILCEDKSTYTKENAVFSRKVTDNANITVKCAIICCKAFHARRSFMYYQMAYPETEIFVVPVECYGINRHNWFTQDYGIERVFGELNRCGSQFCEYMKEFLKHKYR